MVRPLVDGLHLGCLLQDRGHVVAVPAYEPTQFLQAFACRLEPLRVCLQAFGIGAQSRCRILDTDHQPFQRLDARRQGRVEFDETLQFATSLSESVDDGVVATVKRFVESGGGVLEGLLVGQNGDLTLEALVLTDFGGQAADLLELVAPQLLLVAQALAFALQPVQASHRIHPSPVGSGRGCRLPAQATALVEEQGVAFRVEQGLVLMLAMQVDEELARFAQPPHGQHGAVDEGPRTSLGADLTAQDEMGVVIELESGFLQASASGFVVIEFEEPLHFATRGAAAYKVSGNRASQDRVEGTDQDGFSRAGFTRDNRQSGTQLDVDVVDEGEAVDSQPSEHGGTSHPSGQAAPSSARQSPLPASRASSSPGSRNSSWKSPPTFSTRICTRLRDWSSRPAQILEAAMPRSNTSRD